LAPTNTAAFDVAINVKDGTITSSFLPIPYAIRYHETEKYGLFVLFGVLFILPMLGIDIVHWFIGILYPMFMRFISIFI
jgi:hypothetical protein